MVEEHPKRTKPYFNQKLVSIFNPNRFENNG